MQWLYFMAYVFSLLWVVFLLTLLLGGYLVVCNILCYYYLWYSSMNVLVILLWYYSLDMSVITDTGQSSNVCLLVKGRQIIVG